MTSAKKIYLAVAGGLVAAGVVLAGIGFIASGFDPAVFTTHVDTRYSTIVLGGVEVDDPMGPPSSSSSPIWARSTPPASPRPSPLLLRRRPPLPKHSAPGASPGGASGSDERASRTRFSISRGVDLASLRGRLLRSDMGSPDLLRRSHLLAVWRLTPI